MTQHTLLPLAAAIPHHLAHEVLDKPADNWLAWEKAVVACLTLAGLDGHLAGTVHYPDPTRDPAGAANWYANDRAVVSFLARKASLSEQTYIMSHAPNGAKAVWDALVARHVDPGPQIRLMREAFGVRYGAEPPAATRARIDELATRIFALGPISKATLISAVTVNAVQDNLDKLNFVGEPSHAYTSERQQSVDDEAERTILSDAGPEYAEYGISQAEQNTIADITGELSNVENVLAPAVMTFPRPAAQHSEKERRHLAQLLFETIERLDATRINPGWEQARKERRSAVRAVEKLQTTLDNLPTCIEEQDAIATITSERSETQFVLLPAVTVYLGTPNERERLRLSELLFRVLERLDGVTLESAWDKARSERREAVKEVQKLQNRLEPSSSGERRALSAILSELSKIQSEFSPAIVHFVRTFEPSTLPNGKGPHEKERMRLSELSLQFLERLDAITVDSDWEEARKERRSTVREVQKLQDMLDIWGP
ncbi:hypothetical protein C8R44DRAFT_817410 [Mycena epipterygia]|nr:hypothetical protein C8R44DRAFT_817410 [Mycena epipterygia]